MVVWLINLIIDISIFAIVTLSLNVEVGYTGIPQFGRTIAVLGGAFAAGSIPGRLLAFIWAIPNAELYTESAYNIGIVTSINAILASNPFIAIIYLLSSLILAAIVGAILGWLTSRPAIRLKEAYLGISLLSFGEIIMYFGINYDPLVGGTVPVKVPDPFSWIWGPLRSVMWAATTALLLILVFIVVHRLTKSPFGRSLKMLRDNELTSNVYGKETAKVRTMSLIIGAIMSSVAGACYVMFVGAANSQAFTRMSWTFWPWAYLMLGGLANNIGIILGVTLFTIARTIIIISKPFLGFLPFEPIWLEYTLAGAVMIIIVLFRPQGLVPEKPETAMSNNELKGLIERIKAKGEGVPAEVAPCPPGADTEVQTPEGASKSDSTTDELSTEKEPPDKKTCS